MKLKFPILLKVILLGIGVSVLTAGTAIVLSYFNQKNRSEETFIENIDNTIDEVQYLFRSEAYGKDYSGDVKAIINYVDEIFEADTEKKTLSDFDNFHDYFLYYSEKYPWVYGYTSGFGLSQEMAIFRNQYFEILNMLTSCQYSSRGISVFIAYENTEHTYVMLADSRMNNPDYENNFFHMAGTYHVINDEDIFIDKGDTRHFGFILSGYKTRFDHIYIQDGDNQKILATVFVQYDLGEIQKESLVILRNELIILGASSISLVLLYAAFSYLLFVKNINRLSTASGKIRENLINKKMDEVIEVKVNANDEMTVLADSFMEMEQEIINYVDIVRKETLEKEKINAELSVASKIQLDALPSSNFDDNKVSVRAYINPAKEVSGDFYDYFYIDDHRLAILISDVSGKGIPASLFMMKGKELIKSALMSSSSLKDAVCQANDALSRNNKELLFITSFVGIIDFKKKEIRYINAGQEKPYIISNNKVIKLEGDSNVVLGVEEGYPFIQESHPFNEGDSIFMFTDGLNESINKDSEEFGYQRIEENLEKNKNSSLSEILENMNNGLKEFIGEEEQFDDVTMLISKFKSNKLSFHFEDKNYDIITEIVDGFENAFASCSEKIKGSTGIIVDELINNLISYEKREDLIIDVNFELSTKGLLINISSNGADYNPFENHKEKYLEEYSSDITDGGFGLSLVKDLASSYSYKYEKGHSIFNIIVSD